MIRIQVLSTVLLLVNRMGVRQISQLGFNGLHRAAATVQPVYPDVAPSAITRAKLNNELTISPHCKC